MEVSVDTAAMGQFIETAGATSLNVHRLIEELRELAVRATTQLPGGGPPGDVAAGLVELLANFVDNEQFVIQVRSDLLEADSSFASPVGPKGAQLAPSTQSGPSIGIGPWSITMEPIGMLGLPSLDDLFGHGDVGSWIADSAAGRFVTGSPWVDPNTDSWVVNLARMGSGFGLGPAFVERLKHEAPGVIDSVIDASVELSVPNQVYLATTDPSRFLNNWYRAGGASVGSIFDSLKFLGGAGAAVVPGVDSLLDRAFGVTPGKDTRESLWEAARTLVSDPDALAEAMLNSEELANDPYKWFGSIAPDVVLEILTGGSAGVSMTRRAGHSGTALSHLDDLPNLRLADDPPTQRFAGEGADALPDDLNLQRLHEPEWADNYVIPGKRHEPFESPETWVDEINGPGRSEPGRGQNCVDCARATEMNWRGRDASAAPIQPGFADGTSIRRIEDWLGANMTPTDLAEIEARLVELGPGSSAIVASRWVNGGAHAYNAVNDGGVIKWVDSQLGQASTWPPAYGPNTDGTLAVFVGPDGIPN